MRYIHPVGGHSSVPFTPKAWPSSVKGEFWFLRESTYQLDSVNQGDWNKLCGISFNPLKPNLNAIMIAWRFNRNLNLFEVAPYFNVNGDIFSFDDDAKILRCVQYEPIEFYIDHKTVNFKPDLAKDWFKCSVPPIMKKSKWTSFRVQPWFGGNKSAPSQVELILNFK